MLHTSSAHTASPSTFSRLGWYLFFGGLHELVHVTVHYFQAGSTSTKLPTLLAQAFLGRYSVVSDGSDDALYASRHAGWIFSVLLAVTLFAIHRMSRKKDTRFSLHEAMWAASVTALEAVSTDLCGFIPARAFSASPSSAGGYLFCGNFGILLINPQVKSSAMDVLERMIQVTMMRGAQQGGVVTFVPDTGTKKSKDDRKGICSRVVNAKRSDLSQRLITKLKKDTQGTRISPDVIQGFFGHTRFATSSKVSMDGTHPHQWEGATIRRCYHPFVSYGNEPDNYKVEARPISVEMFITHNGDLDFFQVQGRTYSLSTIQEWLQAVMPGVAMPSTVDSAAIAGLLNIIRVQGCFGTSSRFAVCLGLPTSDMEAAIEASKRGSGMPTEAQYQAIGRFFEPALAKAIDELPPVGVTSGVEMPRPEGDKKPTCALDRISTDPKLRQQVAAYALEAMTGHGTRKSAAETAAIAALEQRLDDEQGASLFRFCQVTVDAFFDNDLFFSLQYIMKHAKGSFGVSVNCTTDAHRQVCFAARGQTMSIAFYPDKGLVCYGSEQAAVKAGLSAKPSIGGEDHPAFRLDLDDLGGEIALLDWGAANCGSKNVAVSPPNRHLPVQVLMDNKLHVVLQTAAAHLKKRTLMDRVVQLEDNSLILPLPDEAEDIIQQDIQDIPSVCQKIQQDWKHASLNRATAWTLRQALTRRMKGVVNGTYPRYPGAVDILFTGCEVSLWLAEQMASDLQKAFPKLGIQAISSNKLLGLFGQDLTIPVVGHPMSQSTHDLKDVLVVIVSHSGGTFAPLACSNLLQSTTQEIFVVASEWDTQIGKQLRAMINDDDHMFVKSRIFSTGVGLRSAEPCSISVAATHQLLTNIFQLISLTILGDTHFRHASGAVITEYDLEVLERCNNENIKALENIVGCTVDGKKVSSDTEKELRAVGSIWAQHVLENAKAYFMSFLYVFATVTSGYPLVTGLAVAFGLNDEQYYYLTRFFDAMIYFWLPQINIFLLRLWEGRNLRHRMVGRTVVIGDCPWVAQAGEAFLSKIFATSYSIAGLNVHSGNPSDHLVHRHTHRVARGSLFVCGRPDGRLSALTSLEATTCLSVNQASSIQSLGGTCESVTIGHNPFKLPLTAWGVFLDQRRPNFLCETIINEVDGRDKLAKIQSGKVSKQLLGRAFQKVTPSLESDPSYNSDGVDYSSFSRLHGLYGDFSKHAKGHHDHSDEETNPSTLMASILKEMIQEKNDVVKLRKVFNEIDADGSGVLDQEEFVQAFAKLDNSVDREAAIKIFQDADADKSGELDFEEFVAIASNPQHSAALVSLNEVKRSGPLLDVVPTDEAFFGEHLRQMYPQHSGKDVFALASSQNLAMELYESRIASMQRFVSMTVLFHQIGKQVQEFFPRLSCGMWGYRMDRTHSIMRIATTASPVSGADVRERMVVLNVRRTIQHAVSKVSRAWKAHHQAKISKALALHNKQQESLLISKQV